MDPAIGGALSDKEIALMLAEAVAAAQAGHPMVSVEKGLKMIVSRRSELERLCLAQDARETVGFITEVGLVVLKTVLSLAVL